jgi:tripartite-type tricarboxylate transporter receptor subunit TctC
VDNSEFLLRLGPHVCGIWFASALSVLSAPTADARSSLVAEFYKGKSITIVVSSGAGGGYDLGARILARYLGEHIPGKPSVIVENMPVGGGRGAAMYMNSAAPRDGTVIASVQSFIPVDPLFDNSGSAAKFDPRQFTWIGSITSSTSVGGRLAHGSRQDLRRPV